MEQQRPFPYLQLLAIVLLSAVVNMILFWIWHTVEFRKLKLSHVQQNDAVRAEIVILEGFVSKIGGTKEEL